ncbi:MAG TPA: four helix bundle protein [Chryseolinea sp.]|nr:four helix bundle protein [Flavobacteriales bacterium]HPM32000.1 four helix bundle protein [Chryseolinea sp.]
MKSFRDLEIFIESKRLAIEVHKLSIILPKHELYEEGSQIRRSSKSITSSIVEGYGRRRYKADFIKYLIYAQSECDETIVHLDFLFETGSIMDQGIYQHLKSDYDSLSKRINKFIQWVEANWNNVEETKSIKPTTGN